jgi:hypothetical protein
VLNFGNIAPKPSASPAIANVIMVIEKTDTAIMNPLTSSRMPVAKISTSASTRSGSVPTQNFDHSS